MSTRVHSSLLNDLLEIDTARTGGYSNRAVHKPKHKPKPKPSTTHYRNHSIATAAHSVSESASQCSADDDSASQCCSTTSSTEPRNDIDVNVILPRVTAANVIHSIRVMESRVLEIALVVSEMSVDVGHIERSMVARILNSVTSNASQS